MTLANEPEKMHMCIKGTINDGRKKKLAAAKPNSEITSEILHRLLCVLLDIEQWTFWNEKFKCCICMSVCWKPFEFVFVADQNVRKCKRRQRPNEWKKKKLINNAKIDRIMDKAQM